MRSRAFWAPRSLHPIARLLLVIVVAVLLCIAIGFSIARGEFTRADLLALALYAGVAAFSWHPTTAALIVMLISSAGVVFTGSGGDLLELAMTLVLVAATCAPWVIGAHLVLLGVLTAYLAANSTALTEGGIYGVAGVGLIALLAGFGFRLVAAREAFLVKERARVVKDLEAIARQEQDRIADELHDGIAHDLTLVLFHARALPRQPDDEARQVSLTTIAQSAEQAMESIQSLLALMRDATTEGPSTPTARYEGDVRAAATSLGTLLTDAGITTRVTVPKTSLGIASSTEQILIETAVEAVTNIMKHAPRSPSATIEIGHSADTAALELVVTNARPSAPTRHRVASGGRGLARARQRLAQVGGRVEASEIDGGWVVRATVPSNDDI